MSYIKQADSGGGGTIGGSIANEQVAFGSGADTIEGANELKYIKTDPSLKFMGDDGSFLVGASGSNFDSDFYFQVYGAESRVDSSLPIRIKGTHTETKFITECNEARTGGEEVGQLQFKGLDSASSVVKYGQIQVDTESNTAGARTSSMLFKVAKSDGTFPEIVRFTGGGVVIGNPDDGDEYTLPMNDGNAGQILQTDGSGNVTFENVPGGGTSFAPTAQVWRTASNVRNNITALAPYAQGSDTSSNFATSLERVFFFPFIAPETVTITKLSVYVSSANASSPDILCGIYSATEYTATNILQRIPDALQMSTTISTSTGGYNDGTVAAASGGSTGITQGTLYYIAYAPVASAAGYSTLQAFNGRTAAIGVSTGNAIQSVIQYTPYSYGDGLALSYPTTYRASATITGAAVTNVLYRVD